MMFDPEKIVRPNILAMSPYSSARDEFSAAEGTFLDANENPFGDLNRYPDPRQRVLKAKLSEIKNLSADKIFVGNGSDEVIDLALRIFCEPGKDKALTFTPTYGMYKVSCSLNNVALIEIPLSEAFEIDLGACKDLLKDPDLKLILLCSPNNPTGNCLNQAKMEQLLSDFTGIVLIDEAYIDFTDTESWLKKIERFPNLIVCQTFSKAWGLAAARLGVAYANERLISYFDKVKPPYNVSGPNQQVALKVLENKDRFDEEVALIKIERERVRTALGKLSIVLRVYPSETNFLLVEFKDAIRVFTSLLGKGIITRDRSGLVKNCLRITIGSPQENDQLINALTQLKL